MPSCGTQANPNPCPVGAGWGVLFGALLAFFFGIFSTR